MRAWVFHGKTDMRLEELPEPEPGPGEIAVRIAYNGICGSDLHEYFHGPLFIPLDQPHPVTGHSGPTTLGHEASGTVASVGEGVTDLAVGDRVALEPVVRRPGDDEQYNLNASYYGVMAPGFLADTAVVQRSAAHVLPPEVSLRDGALSEPLAVAWHAALRAALNPHETAVVFGGGPIGIGTALSMRAQGVRRVVVVEPSPQRRAIVERLSLPTLDPASADFTSRLAEFTDGGAGACVDAAGVPAAITSAIEALGPHGRLVIVAAHMVPVAVDTNQLLISERSIIGSMGYLNDFPRVIEELALGTFPTTPWVESIAFEELVEQGFDRLAAGQGVKILVNVGGN